MFLDIYENRSVADTKGFFEEETPVFMEPTVKLSRKAYMQILPYFAKYCPGMETIVKNYGGSKHTAERNMLEQQRLLCQALERGIRANAFTQVREHFYTKGVEGKLRRKIRPEAFENLRGKGPFDVNPMVMVEPAEPVVIDLEQDEEPVEEVKGETEIVA